MADEAAGDETACSGRHEHARGVALVFLLLVFLALLAVGVAVAAVGITLAAGVAVVVLVVRGAEETALVVAGCVAVGRAWRAAGRRGVWALGGRCVCGRLPLGAAGSLVDVVPALAVLVPLGYPAGRHWGRCAILWDG